MIDELRMMSVPGYELRVMREVRRNSYCPSDRRSSGRGCWLLVARFWVLDALTLLSVGQDLRSRHLLCKVMIFDSVKVVNSEL